MCALVAATLWSTAAAAEPPPRAPSAAPKAPAPAAPAEPQPTSPPSVSAAPNADPELPRRYKENFSPVRDSIVMQRNLAAVTGGVGIAGIVVGGLFGILSLSQWNSVESQLGTCTDRANYSGCPDFLKDEQNKASSYATVSTFCFLTGSAAIAGGVVMWFTAPRLPTSAARIKFAPMVGKGGAAGVLTGVF
jgi:hypothetical protein